MIGAEHGPTTCYTRKPETLILAYSRIRSILLFEGRVYLLQVWHERKVGEILRLKISLVLPCLFALETFM